MHIHLPPSSSSVRALLSSVVAVLVVCGMAPGASGASRLIHACVHKNSGQLRIVAGTAECNPSERHVSWPRNVSKGVAGYEIVFAISQEAVPVGARFGLNAECPDPKVVLGGGFVLGDAFNPNPRLLVRESAPLINNEGFYDGKFWHVEVENVGDAPSFFSAYAVCALASD